MEDEQIITLYWERNESAIRETDAAYGKKLHTLSHNILHSHEDSQECVSDTYLKAWNTIPPQWPQFFFAYLAKICRFITFGKLDWNNAAKRKADVVALTAELENCIPDRRVEDKLEGEALGTLLNEFLETLPRDSRLIFLRRYWYADSIEEIALRYSMGTSRVKTQLHRTRLKLREYLQKEGITV